jgi:hypothetical protein
MSANLVLLVYFSITSIRSGVNRFDENNNNIGVKKKRMSSRKTSPQCKLCILGHGICFIQQDQFNSRLCSAELTAL